MAGILYVVATPIGNLEDVTFRALRVLREVALIAAEDTRRTAKLLQHYSISTPTTSLHAHNEHAKTPHLIERLKAGESIALVSDAGTPAISDPGARLVAAAHAAGVAVQPVPGASAVTAMVSASGIGDGGFLFAGFAPNRSSHRKKWLQELRGESRAVVFYEAPHRIKTTLADIDAEMGSRTVAIGRELTKIHEFLAVRPIKQWIEQPPLEQGEFVVVIFPPLADTTHGAPAPSVDEIAQVFGRITENKTGSRREAMRETAKHLNIRVRDVFVALEEHKKSGD